MQNSLVILVVDDEVDLRDLIAEEFEMSGYTVTRAGSGNEALAHLSKQHFDAIITDLRMDNGDGRLIIETVDKMSGHKPLVFLISGYVDDEDPKVLAKAYAILQKPIKWQKLTEIVGIALGKKA